MKNIIRMLFLLLLLLSYLGCGRFSEQSEGSPPNILLVLVDALRADHVSSYGYARQTSPFLDEYSKRGIRFSKTYSHSSHTKISVASLLTGLIPPSHQVRTASFSDRPGRVKSDILSTSALTIAEILQRHGYLTAGFVTNPHLQAFQGFAQGFNEYQYQSWDYVDAEGLNEKAIFWLGKHIRFPYFLYLHYMDVHYPYNPPAPYRTLYTKKRKDLKPLRINGPPSKTVNQEMIDYSMALYDAQINYWDESFRKFVKQLDNRGWLENTIVVIVADHGDEFNEHGGFGHGFTLYTEMLHVPMYFIFKDKLPSGVVRDDLTRLIDVVPTLCGLAGIETKGLNLEGLDLFDANSTQTDTELIVYSETDKGKKPQSVRTVAHQLIFNTIPQTWEFYDLKEDPEEKTNLHRENTPEVSRLAGKLFEFVKGKSPHLQPESMELDKKTIEELRSLGYLH